MRCFGKGHKERMMPIYEQAALAVKDYAEQVRPGLVHKSGEKALFVNLRGDRLTRQGFWQILKDQSLECARNAEATARSSRELLLQGR